MISYVCLWHDEKTFRECVLASLQLRGDDELIALTDYDSWGLALAHGEARAKNDIIVLIHQDTVFTQCWRENLLAEIGVLDSRDPEWGIAGVTGYVCEQLPDGRVGFWLTGTWQDLGGDHPDPAGLPRKVYQLDAPVVIKKRGDPPVDPTSPGFVLVHDLCYQMHEEGRSVWVLPVYTGHRAHSDNRSWTDEQIDEWSTFMLDKWNRPFIWDGQYCFADRGESKREMAGGICKTCHFSAIVDAGQDLGQCTKCGQALVPFVQGSFNEEVKSFMRYCV